MNCKNCKKHGCSLAGKNHEMSFECKAYVGKTNADRIRSMTDEELAWWISDAKYIQRDPAWWEMWLKSPVEVDE